MTKIGIFDSGLGGLSILKEVHLLDRVLDIYYIADSKNNPYGDKTQEFILKRCHEIVQQLIDQGCELIVLACNTATARAIDVLRQGYPEIEFVGVEPYINVINKREDLKSKKGLIMATPSTGESQRFIELKKRLDPKGFLDTYLPSRLAKIIEDNFFTSSDLAKKLKRELEQYPKGYDFYILGCTHYPLVSEILSHELGAEMISPCPMVAKQINKFITHETGQKKDSFFFMNTGISEDWDQLSYLKIFK